MAAKAQGRALSGQRVRRFHTRIIRGRGSPAFRAMLAKDGVESSDGAPVGKDEGDDADGGQ